MFKLRLLTILLLCTAVLAQTPPEPERVGVEKVKTPAESAQRPTESPAADEVFVPAEDIEDDLSVSYPVDI